MDADAFEVLSQGNIHSAATFLAQRAGDEPADLLESAMEETAPFDVPNAGTSPTVFVDRFPLGSAGTPIPGILQGPLVHDAESNQAVGVESVWAPFNSECDWKFARWAKTRGPTSSAVTDLLAIGEVWTLLH
jgi:hypothetical protein